ncbi:MAG TPA: DUF2690 domain-containing protein [Trichocoleus sp.]|jgi:hypothetical protein
MKRLALCSLGLLSTLSIHLTSGLTWKALAEKPQFCRGADCNGKDPVEYQCDSDASIESETTITVRRWQELWQPQEITIQKMYSETCNANWTKAYIPNDTYLFIQEQEVVNDTQPTHGMAHVDGTGYFWATSNMSSSQPINQACVSLSGGAWFAYDRYCTDFQ